jgi:hypothetical protein
MALFRPLLTAPLLFLLVVAVLVDLQGLLDFQGAALLEVVLQLLEDPEVLGLELGQVSELHGGVGLVLGEPQLRRQNNAAGLVVQGVEHIPVQIPHLLRILGA